MEVKFIDYAKSTKFYSQSANAIQVTLIVRGEDWKNVFVGQTVRENQLHSRTKLFISSSVKDYNQPLEVIDLNRDFWPPHKKRSFNFEKLPVGDIRMKVPKPADA